MHLQDQPHCIIPRLQRRGFGCEKKQEYCSLSKAVVVVSSITEVLREGFARLDLKLAAVETCCTFRFVLIKIAVLRYSGTSRVQEQLSQYGESRSNRMT